MKQARTPHLPQSHRKPPRAAPCGESERLLDVPPAKVTNVPGDGARKAWAYMDRFAGDPRMLSIGSPSSTTDHLAGIASFDHAAYTPLAILCTGYKML